jgi:hypothetical protein
MSCCVQVNQVARAASQAKVLQLLQQGSEGAATAAARGRQQDTDKQAAQISHPGQPPSAADWAPGGIWGLGTCNTMQWFEDSCGVKFREKHIEQRALFGGQDPSVFVEL